MTALARDLEGLPVTVMGLGLFGGGAAVSRWLTGRGARVTVTDLRSAEELRPALRTLAGFELRFVLGEHRTEDFTRAAMVIANPAVPPENPYLRAARAAGARVTSEMALFLERCPARIAAVTGTQGKSSTCNTSAQLLSACGFRAHLGGNIGRSLLESLDEMQPEDVAIVEVSSYQLEALPLRLELAGPPVSAELAPRAEMAPRVEVAAVTNVLADHLERHGSVEAYAAAKRRILTLALAAGGTAILSAEDPRTLGWREPGLRRLDIYPTHDSDTGLNLREGSFRVDRTILGRVPDLRIRGDFQRENTLMALGIAHLFGARAERLAEALAGVTALPHRLEDLGVRRGHRVWDNGVSTTPDSTISALASIQPGCTLLCGGKAKKLPLDELVLVARARARRTVVFGDAGPLFGSAFRAAGIETWIAPTVEAAVAAAYERMEADEEMLFSPAASSFDAFLNFEERAEAFRRALPAAEPGSRAPAGR